LNCFKLINSIVFLEVDKGFVYTAVTKRTYLNSLIKRIFVIGNATQS
jgi:hypothetical protein